ncbi:MAG TPA: N-(5'-phosphoribosyl)anthranilate isomerase [Lachnospiraceae bacterium]|nr:N-(5'-phosphoribosyl)anthranilate isomerase [Lachnospiraceae bacterium]
MTKIKLCGLTELRDIEVANSLVPEYIGFVFAEKSRRYVLPEKAAEFKRRLAPGIRAVGVFVNESPERIAGLLEAGIIDVAQLHGSEDGAYIRRVRELTERPLIQAFSMDSAANLRAAEESPADYILLDSGKGGTGNAFNWELVQGLRRPFFLAGGLHVGNAAEAVRRLSPYGVDVSSGIETNGKKDAAKMAEFVHLIRRI